MGTLASGSIDLKSLKVAGEEANKYITAIDNSGIRVHAESNPTTNYTKISSDGMEVFKDSDSVSKFGNEVRVGKLNQGSIVIDDDGITGYGEYGQEFFSFGSSTSTDSGIKQCTIVQERTGLPNTSATGLTGELIPVSPTSGTDVVLNLTVTFEGPYDETTLTFTSGTSETKSVTYGAGGNIYTFYATYNGDRAFTNIYSTPAFPTAYYDIKCKITAQYEAVAGAPTFVLGSGSSATGVHSVAIGKNNSVTGAYAKAFGDGLIVSKTSQVVVGRYNSPTNSDVFQIGYGIGDDYRGNAFTVNDFGGIRATTETVSISASNFSVTTGKISSVSMMRFGNVVQLVMTVTKTSATAAGNDMFAGTLDLTDYRPKMTTECSSYSGSIALVGRMQTNGKINVNVTGAQLAANRSPVLSFTYLI